jgi:HCOMODA/2-hydroxy-3-carboxy-muconic semialdehyde decarboxylase
MTPSFPYSRRRLLHAGLALGAAHLAGVPGIALAQAPRAAEGAALAALPEFRRLVAANRILANENIVDAFGHVSARDPRNVRRFVMSRSRSPALVEHADHMEFELDGTPVDARGRTAYGERMIHGAIYAARADVNAVVHYHAYSILPFTITDAKLVPVIHTASIIGAEIPVWDIRDAYGDTDMLVRTIEQGGNLAATLADNTCLLMRGHGAVVVGATVPQAVLTAIYLQVNASVLLDARTLGEPEGLSDEEIARAAATQFSPLALDRAWEHLCLRAGVDPA